MSDKNVNVNGSFPVFGLLGIVFVTLKLTGYIDWSWWWVTAPFWGPAVLVLVLLGVLGGAAWALARRQEKQHEADRARRLADRQAEDDRRGR